MGSSSSMDGKSVQDTDTSEVFPGTPENPQSEVILELRNLKKYFGVQSKSLLLSKVIGYIKAVDGVDLQIYDGEVLGLVGESGCGKSTLSKLIVGLEEPTLGQVWYKDMDITKLKGRKEKLQFRRNIQMIFQDPYNSLNPRKLVKDTLKEPLTIHFGHLSNDEKEKMVSDLLRKVGLETYHGYRYPHEFSGGQRQRIGLARALIINPKIVIADEPVSALDVSVQATILNLVQKLQKEFGLSIIFIAHDLSVVKHVSDRVAVMYLGRIVEIGPTERIFDKPAHPYTVSLLSAIPFADPDIKKKKIILKGDVPSPINLPTGCRFHERCYKVEDICKIEDPKFREISNGCWAACHFPEDEQVIKFVD
ncbi:MAG: Oligopeptide transport ATP-binding protein OppF [Candidatus Heimdallarchaeota archaeon LC_2]|nr:MAG: Oligopeptide transport ATP-binding protein OppF [Candidatus Heimdallarchaeota archaeon LC_2]